MPGERWCGWRIRKPPLNLVCEANIGSADAKRTAWKSLAGPLSEIPWDALLNTISSRSAQVPFSIGSAQLLFVSQLTATNKTRTTRTYAKHKIQNRAHLSPHLSTMCITSHNFHPPRRQAGEVSHKVEELKGKLCRKSELTFEALGDAILYENPEMYEELNALHTQKKEDRDGGWASASKSGHDVLAEWLHPVSRAKYQPASVTDPGLVRSLQANGLWVPPNEYGRPPGYHGAHPSLTKMPAGLVGQPLQLLNNFDALQMADGPMPGVFRPPVSPADSAVAVEEAERTAHLGKKGDISQV